MRIQRFILVFFALTFHLAKSTTWVTISSGFWNNPSTWSTGIVPPFNSSDTFRIKHPVAFGNNLVFNSGAFLKIDTTGGLCAHNSITLKSGAKCTMYGLLEIDSLLIPGGQASLLSPGAVTLTCYGILSLGGSLSVTSALMVGPWFSCRSPEFLFAGIDELSKSISLKVYPNPTLNTLHIETQQNEFENSEIEITNSIGKCVLKTLYSETIDISKLSQGFYNLKIIAQNRLIYYSKFIKE